MAEPLVSAVLPSYNYGRFISDAIRSILAQEDPGGPIEIIVIDDGSKDDTPERVAAFGDRVRYYRQANQGVAAAVNKGVSLARGKYVCFMDPDDLWTPDKVRTVVTAFEAESDIGCVLHGSRSVDVAGRPLPETPAVPLPKRITLDDLLVSPCWPPGSNLSTVSLRRDILELVGPIPLEFVNTHPDGYVYYHSLFFAPARQLSGLLTLYRQHGVSWSYRWSTAKGNMRDLKLGHNAHRNFFAHLKRRLRREGKSLNWPLEYKTHERRVRLESLVILNAHAGARRRAWRLLQELKRSYPAGFERTFKTATMAFAIAAPRLHSGLFRFYVRNTWLLKLLGRDFTAS